MDLQKDKYIIAEIIPTRSRPEYGGIIAQLSALKLEGTKLIDRFDYRVDNKYIDSVDIKRMISYDKKGFQYVKSGDFILEKFRRWSEGLPILTVDNTYTPRYFESLENHQELAFPYLGIEFSDEAFDQVMEKYPIEPTFHLVDVIYEAIIYEGFTKKTPQSPKSKPKAKEKVQDKKNKKEKKEK